MPRNGSGGFSLVTNSWNVATNGVAASAADWQALINDLATAVQQSISSDGQTPITGNLQMGGNRLTGLGAGSATGQSLRFEQLFSQGALVDIASAGVMDIGTPLTNFLRVTGSTTITGFGTNYNGPRYLIFAAAVILTHSATLVLPGAANITTGVNDSLIAVPISGGWQVVAYQRASGLPAVAGPLASSGITGAAASGANNDITSLTALASVPTIITSNVVNLTGNQTVAGTKTFTSQPVVPAPSRVEVNTYNGYGSTNTVIMRFSTVAVNSGSDITYADSATLGNSFTINTNGIYSFTLVGGNNIAVGLSKNSAQLTTSITTITGTARLASNVSSSNASASYTGYFLAGDVVRAHLDGSAQSVVPNMTAVRIS